MSKNANEAMFKSMPQNDRVTALRENAAAQYNKNVVRNYTEEELTEMKHQLSEKAILINDAEIERKEIVKEVSDRIKEHKKGQQHLLKGIKNKYYETEETVFDIANHEDGIMETFDAEGNLLGMRRLTPAEKQKVIQFKQAQ